MKTHTFFIFVLIVFDALSYLSFSEESVIISSFKELIPFSHVYNIDYFLKDENLILSMNTRRYGGFVLKIFNFTISSGKLKVLVTPLNNYIDPRGPTFYGRYFFGFFNSSHILDIAVDVDVPQVYHLKRFNVFLHKIDLTTNSMQDIKSIYQSNEIIYVSQPNFFEFYIFNQSFFAIKINEEKEITFSEYFPNVSGIIFGGWYGSENMFSNFSLIISNFTFINPFIYSCNYLSLSLLYPTLYNPKRSELSSIFFKSLALYTSFLYEINIECENLPHKISYTTFLKTYYTHKPSIFLNSSDKLATLYSILLAGYLNLPLITDENLLKDFPPLYNITSANQAIEIYLNEIKKRNENINEIVVSNINSKNSYLAARYSFLYHAFPIFINVSINEKEYENCLVEGYNPLIPKEYYKINDTCSINKKAFEIRNEILKTIKFLNSKGFLFNSLQYKLNNSIPKITIIGKEDEIPFFIVPFIPNYIIPEIFFNQKDDFILTDSIYCNFNFSQYLIHLSKQNAICSRIYGDEEQISYQIELSRFSNLKNALIVSNRANVKELSLYSNKLASAFYAYGNIKNLINATLKTKKEVEIDEINLTTIPKFIEELLKRIKIKNFEGTLLAKLYAAFLIVQSIYDVQNYLYQFDWFTFYENLQKGKLESIKAFKDVKKEDLNKYDFLIYFAASDLNGEYWIIENSTSNFTIYQLKTEKPIFLINSHFRSFHFNSTSKRFLENGIVTLIAITARYAIPTLDWFIGYDVLKYKDFTYGLFREKNFQSSLRYGDLNSIFSVNYFFNPNFNVFEKREIKIQPLIKFFDFEKSEFKAKSINKIENEKIFSNETNKTIIFTYSDDLIIDYNKPPIFVNKYSFETQAKKIKDVKVKTKKEIVKNVEIFVQDKNFTRYPENEFEYSIVKLENGKNFIELNVYPIIYYPNETAEIINEFEIEITYEPKIEFKEIKQEELKNKTLLKLNVYSDDFYNANLTIFILNETIKKNVFLQKDENEINLEIEKFEFEINATLLLETEDYYTLINYTIKPIKKEKAKKIEEFEEPFYKYFSSNLLILKNWKKEIREEKNSEYYKKEIINPFYKIEILIKDKTKFLNFISFDKEYFSIQNSTHLIESLTSSNGKIERIIYLSQVYEYCTGNCKYLRKIMEEIKNEIENG